MMGKAVSSQAVQEDAAGGKGRTVEGELEACSGERFPWVGGSAAFDLFKHAGT